MKDRETFYALVESHLDEIEMLKRELVVLRNVTNAILKDIGVDSFTLSFKTIADSLDSCVTIKQDGDNVIISSEKINKDGE